MISFKNWLDSFNAENTKGTPTSRTTERTVRSVSCRGYMINETLLKCCNKMLQNIMLLIEYTFL